MRESMALLRRYMGDVRSLLPGGATGIMQLMYPPLGEAVAAQSDFFDDPFGRVYRSIPQIWAVVLDSGRDGQERGRAIRDLHRDVKGVDAAGKRYHALEPETFWWAHATFTWEVFRSIELFHAGGLRRVDTERLYRETVSWYECYAMSMRPVPPDLQAFRRKFGDIVATKLERTPAAERTLEMAVAGRWRLPLQDAYLHDPLMRLVGRVGVFGCFPPELRERFGLAWSRTDAAVFAAGTQALRLGFGAVPLQVNHAAMRTALRTVGARTRSERYDPAA
ncbi:MAG: oxygenase MpaB family protein [Acidimicrobiia bacterium]